jgi:ABC-2 type transport system ATP-binding protein
MIGDRNLNDFSVEANGLTKYFGNYKAVDHVSLAVPTGSIYGVLGPNGAGKTTSLRMTLGIIDPDEGASQLFGGHKPQSVRNRIGYLPEERGLYPGMKAREAIAFMGALRGLDWAEGRRRAERFMTELGLERVVDTKIRKMSKGMAQMIQLIGSIVHSPDLIVLDEPFSGLDPVNQERLEMLVRRERDRGATILFSTHVMAHAERSARRFEGTVDEARALLPMQVRYTPRTASDPAAVASNLPAGAELRGDAWHFAIGDSDVEPLLARITASGLGVIGLSISRPALHDAFVHIVRQVDAGFDADATEDAVEEASA